MSYETFEVEQIHLNLLQALYIHWEDDGYHGTPIINPKRPYGNSDILEDVYFHLHGEYYEDDDGDGSLPEPIYGEMYKIHATMHIPLQILTENLSIQLGKYEKKSMFDTWSKVDG